MSQKFEILGTLEASLKKSKGVRMIILRPDRRKCFQMLNLLHL
jgi:hypothetical protein